MPNSKGKTPERFAADFKSEHYERLSEALDWVKLGELAPSPIKNEKEQMSFRSDEVIEIESAYEDEISSDRGISISNHALQLLT